MKQDIPVQRRADQPDARDTTFTPEIARAGDLSVEAFIEGFERPGVPVILQSNLAWPAFDRWTRQFLARALDGVAVDVSDGCNRVRSMFMPDFLRHLDDPLRRETLYLKDLELSAVPFLLADYAPPRHFAGALIQPSEWRWIYLGPAASGSPLHTDTDRSAAWNTVIYGQKAWWFFLDDGTIQRGITGPGETIFSPPNCRHAAINLVETLAVTHNYFRDEQMLAAAWQTPVTFEPKHEEVRRRLARIGRSSK